MFYRPCSRIHTGCTLSPFDGSSPHSISPPSTAAVHRWLHAVAPRFAAPRLASVPPSSPPPAPRRHLLHLSNLGVRSRTAVNLLLHHNATAHPQTPVSPVNSCFFRGYAPRLSCLMSIRASIYFLLVFCGRSLPRTIEIGNHCSSIDVSYSQSGPCRWLVSFCRSRPSISLCPGGVQEKTHHRLFEASPTSGNLPWTLHKHWIP